MSFKQRHWKSGSPRSYLHISSLMSFLLPEHQRYVQDKYDMCEDRNTIARFLQIRINAAKEIQMSVTLNRTMLLFGLLVCISAAEPQTAEPQMPFKFEVFGWKPKTQNVSMHLKMCLRATARGPAICQGQGQFQSTPLSSSATSLRSPSPNKW